MARRYSAGALFGSTTSAASMSALARSTWPMTSNNSALRSKADGWPGVKTSASSNRSSACCGCWRLKSSVPLRSNASKFRGSRVSTASTAASAAARSPSATANTATARPVSAALGKRRRASSSAGRASAARLSASNATTRPAASWPASNSVAAPLVGKSRSSSSCRPLALYARINSAVPAERSKPSCNARRAARSPVSPSPMSRLVAARPAWAAAESGAWRTALRHSRWAARRSPRRAASSARCNDCASAVPARPNSSANPDRVRRGRVFRFMTSYPEVGGGSSCRRPVSMPCVARRS